MALDPGTKLGAFELTGLLGKGGMGEVYRARDTKLGRDVAIKVLPEAVAGDGDYLARFEREAVALAALNHSNVAGIHGFHHVDGTHFLEMELVEGETLSERIEKGALSVDDAIPIFIQIAEGLEAAHERNLIHRDLKPANIKITPKGVVKILDFGMAKETGLQSNQPVSHSAATKPISPSPGTLTTAGMILGTPNYMSPEQARGMPLDKRTDIWAFGCCLFQALAGEIPFQGSTIMDILGGVLNKEPDWNKLPSRLPRQLTGVLRRCLEKDPGQRLHDIADARLSLREAQDNPDYSDAAGGAPGLNRARAIALLLLGAAAGALAVWSVFTLRSPDTVPVAAAPEPKVVSRSYINLAPDDKFAVQLRTGAGLLISPDGQRFYYVSEARLAQDLPSIMMRHVDELEYRALPGTTSGRNPFLSPDGRWLGFYSFGEKKLFIMPAEGGPPQPLCDAPGVRGAVWMPDDRIVFSTDQNDDGSAPASVGSRPVLNVVSAAGGSPELLTRPDPSKNEIGHFWPALLPDGRHILFSILYEDLTSKVAVLDLETKEYRLLGMPGIGPQYLPTGHLVTAESQNLFAAAFDPENVALRGRIVPVVTGLQSGESTWQRGDYSVSQAGTLVFAPAGMSRDTVNALTWVEPDGSMTQAIVAPPGSIFRQLNISPDGRSIALSMSRETNRQTWIYDIARDSLTTRLPVDGDSNNPVWLPSGEQILVSEGNAGMWSVVLVRADGAGDSRVILEPTTAFQGPYDVTPDGRYALIARSSAETGDDIWICDLSGTEAPRPFLQSEHNEGAPQFSPDGRWVAYHSDQSGRNEVYVRPFDGQGRWPISTDGGSNPRWSPDGKRIYYDRDGSIWGVDVEIEAGVRAGKPTRLLERNTATTAHTFFYDVHPDGRLMVQTLVNDDGEDSPQQFVVVTNWFEELKRLVPVPETN